jgi:hypothetical protein
MHIDRANQITVAPEEALVAHPISVLGFMLMATSGTAATGSSFRAGEARDVGLLRFVSQIVDIFAILPLSHALIVVSATIFTADPVRIANEERTDLVFDTEGDDFACGFVA